MKKSGCYNIIIAGSIILIGAGILFKPKPVAESNPFYCKDLGIILYTTEPGGIYQIDENGKKSVVSNPTSGLEHHAVVIKDEKYYVHYIVDAKHWRFPYSNPNEEPEERGKEGEYYLTLNVSPQGKIIKKVGNLKDGTIRYYLDDKVINGFVGDYFEGLDPEFTRDQNTAYIIIKGNIYKSERIGSDKDNIYFSKPTPITKSGYYSEIEVAYPNGLEKIFALKGENRNRREIHSLNPNGKDIKRLTWSGYKDGLEFDSTNKRLIYTKGAITQMSKLGFNYLKK